MNKISGSSNGAYLVGQISRQVATLFRDVTILVVGMKRWGYLSERDFATMQSVKDGDDADPNRWVKDLPYCYRLFN